MTDVPRFGDRLAGVLSASGHLCVGIDPHPFLLEQWGLGDDAAGARELGLRVVEAARGRAGIVKPQVAFFERHGSAGFATLEDVLAAARSAGLLVIGDVKRGDVGSSVEAYGQAWLAPGSPLEVDAITVSAYQGVGSLAAPLELARRNGKGLFVLAATSNQEATALQSAVIGDGPRAGSTVAAGIVADVMEWNAATNAVSPTTMGNVGVVLGATVPLERFGLDPSELLGPPALPVLAPGFGHQGAKVADLGALFGAAAAQVIVSVSRSVLSAGPSGIAGAIADHAGAVSLLNGSSWNG